MPTLINRKSRTRDRKTFFLKSKNRPMPISMDRSNHIFCDSSKAYHLARLHAEASQLIAEAKLTLSATLAFDRAGR